MVKIDRAEIEFLAKDLASSIIKKIDENVEKLDKTTKKTSKGMDNSFTSLANSIRLGLGISIANLGFEVGRVLAEQFKRALISAVEFETQIQSLNNQTDRATDLISDLKKATNGLVSELDLAKSANRALAFGLDEEALPALAATATALGKIQGLDSTQAFNDIVVGIARASPLILDNLGIVLDAEKTYGAYAESIGTVASELSKAEKLIALQNSTIKSATTEILKNALAVKTTSEQWQEFTSNVKDVTTNVLLRAIEGYATLTDGIMDNIEIQKKANEQLTETTGKQYELGGTLGYTRKEMEVYNQVEQNLNKDKEKFNNLLTNTNEILKENSKDLQDAGSELKNYKSDLDDLRNSFKSFLSEQTEDQFENDKEILRLKREQLIVETAIAKSREGTPTGVKTGEDLKEAKQYIEEYNKEFGTSIEYSNNYNQKIQDRIDLLTKENELVSISQELLQKEREADIAEATGEEVPKRVKDFQEYVKTFDDYTQNKIPLLNTKITNLEKDMQELQTISLEVAENFVNQVSSLTLMADEAERLERALNAIDSIKKVTLTVDIERQKTNLIGG